LRLRQNEQRQGQLGGVAETDVEQAANGGAGVFGDLLGAASNPVGKDCYGGQGGEEYPNRWDDIAVVQRKRQRRQK
jgi:hypothetical protein